MSKNGLSVRMLGIGVGLSALLGAFATTAMAGRVLDITSYGAIANDGKDDTAAIKAAIAAAGAGDTVTIPAGEFDISSAVSAKSNLTISGAATASSVLKFIGTSSSNLMNLDGVSNVALTGFTLDGNNSTAAAQGVWSQNSSKLSIENIAVKNLNASGDFGPQGIYFASKVTDSVVSNSTFTNIGTNAQWGAGIRVGQGSSRNQILSNTISNTGRGGILCDDNSTDLIIRKNTVTGSGKVSDGLGIELWGGCDRSIVEDNNIDHWLSVDSSNNLAIRRNVVSDKSGTYKYCGLELVDAHDDIFTDNTVDGGQQIGISESGSGAKERIFFGNNTIKTASTWGIQIQGETGKASKQYFYRNTFTNTLKNDPKTLYAPQGNGVRFNGDADHIVMDQNTITSNQGAGVQITGSNVSDLRFVGNTITGNGDVAVDGSAPNSVWSGNTVSGNANNNAMASLANFAMPTATMSQDNSARVGEELTFSLNTSGIGTIANVLWDFGEGLPVTSTTATHTYLSPGKYNVTAIAWDTSGQAAFQQMTLNVTTSVPEPKAMLPAVLLIGSMGMMLMRRRSARGACCLS